jgi:hypothetical protein
MALIDDLKAIDGSAIADARTAIQAAINSPALSSALESGAARSALGELGALLEAVQNQDPAELVRPLARGFADLHGTFAFDSLPLGRYASSVADGLGLIAKLTAGFDGDFSKVGSAFGVSLDDVLGRAHGQAGSVLATAYSGGGAIWTLAQEIDRGAPASPDAVVDLLLRALLPLPSGALGDVRGVVSRLHAGAAAIALPTGRADGLIAAFARVEAAAVAHDAAALAQALRFVDQVRTSTIGSVRNDLTLAVAQVRRIDIAAAVAPLTRADKELRGLSEGLLDQFARWRELIAMLRRNIEDFDATAIVRFLDESVHEIEAFVERTILAFIDEQVRRAVEWMRALFRHIPITAIRAEITGFLHKIAQAIAKADVGQYARAVHALLEKIRTLVSPEALRAEIQKALAAAAAAIDAALDEVIDKLAVVKDAIAAVAGEASEVVGRIVPALTAFNDAVIEIKAGAAAVGLEEAGRQVVEQLDILRQAAEQLLTESPLPDSMKEEVARIVDFVRAIDLDASFAPVRQAAAQLTLPADVAAAVDSGLAEAAVVIDNIIPARLIEGIEADVQAALSRMTSFNPGALLPDMKGFLNTAADAVEKLSPPPQLAAELHAPFQKLLDLIDAAHPMVLLAPAIAAYDKALAVVPVPSPGNVSKQGVGFVTSLGERAANAVIAPLEALVGGAGARGGAAPPLTTPGGTGSVPPPAGPSLPTPGSGTPVGASSPGAVPPADLRPGDIIRFLGYIPGELRSVLAKMEAGTLGQVMARLDGFTAGLARDLRAAAAAVSEADARLHADMHAMLSPLAEHQARAQLAVRANFRAGEVDVNAAMSTLALAGPGALRHELGGTVRLVRETTAEMSGRLTGTLGVQLTRTAAALDACLLSRLAGDADALLAALDPEPIAAEIDALFEAVLAKAPEILAALGDAVRAALDRVRNLVNALNPGVLAQRFLAVLDVVREQFDALSPRRLAAELGEIHEALRSTIAAFDPGPFVTDIAATVGAVAASLRSLDPATLVGDITLLNDAVAKLQAAVPTKALAGVGVELQALGEQLAAVDLEGLLDAVKTLGPQIVDEAETAAAALKQEILALLESLQYASGSASASVAVQA